MDHLKANKLAAQLQGSNFHGYHIEQLLNNGKSAAVFLARHPDGNQVALKIFDNEIVERFGHEIQLQRINQEISLKGHQIPHLISIIDGGEELIDDTTYLYIIMAFIKGQNLKEYITSTTYEPYFVKQVGIALFEVTEKLLEKGIAHRDIKPENVMVDDSGNILLMDLGVLKLIGEPSATDAERKEFIGTLLYAPPEFLTRKETDDQQGWRAVNYYQIGAVMHDLIMKKEIFGHVSPYANIVIAIKEDAPNVSSPNYSFETIQLTRDLLTKDPDLRLRNVSSQRLAAWSTTPETPQDDVGQQMQALLNLGSAPKAKLLEIAEIERSTKERLEIRGKLASDLELFINECFKKFREIGGPEVSSYPHFAFAGDLLNNADMITRNLFYLINGKLENGFATPMGILVRFSINERAESTIDLLGVGRNFNLMASGNTPQELFKQIAEQVNPRRGVGNQLRIHNEPIRFNGPYYSFFKGTIGLDQQLADRLLTVIIKFVQQGILYMQKEVECQMQMREASARGGSHRISSRIIDGKFGLIYKIDE